MGDELTLPFSQAADPGCGQSLAVEGVLGFFNFDNDVFQTDEVLLARFQLVLGLPFLVLVIGGAGRFFYQQPLFLGLRGDEGTYGSLFYDKVFFLADRMLPKFILNIFLGGQLFRSDGIRFHPNGRPGGR